MKYAILSDVHSNPDALERALEDAWDHDVDKVICLGDVVGYGPDPVCAVELVRNSCDVVLMGNHDAAVAGLVSTDGYLGSAAEGVRRNREQLSEEDLAWLKSLPYVHSEAGFDCAHGSFAEAERFHYTQDAFDAKASLRTSEARFQFVGHTHVLAVWNWDQYLWDPMPMCGLYAHKALRSRIGWIRDILTPHGQARPELPRIDEHASSYEEEM